MNPCYRSGLFSFKNSQLMRVTKSLYCRLGFASSTHRRQFSEYRLGIWDTFRPSGACCSRDQCFLYTFRLSEAIVNHISAPAVRNVYRIRITQNPKRQRCDRCITQYRADKALQQEDT